MSKRIPQEEFIRFAKEKFGKKFSYDLSEYKGIKSKIKIFCSEKDHFGNAHGWFKTTCQEHLKGKGGCKSCANAKSYLVRNYDDFVYFAHIAHAHKFDYSKFIFKNSRGKGIIICKKSGHGEFLANPHNHIGNKTGCPICYEERRGLKSSLGKREGEPLIIKFLRDAPKIHNNKFDYSHLGKDLDLRDRDLVKIKCPEHGFITVQVSVHLNGHDCLLCSQKENGLKKRKDQKLFIKECKKKWGFDDDYYSLVNYTGKENKIKLKCKIHGVFEIRAGNHFVQGQGCIKCAGIEKKSREQIIKLSIQKHGNLYNYDSVEDVIKNSKEKITIRCNLHGLFKQSAVGHYLMGYGCPECGRLKSGVDNLRVFSQQEDRANRYCELYLVRVKQFLKIGISEDTYKRDPKRYEEYYLIEPSTRAIAWCVEQYILLETQWMEPAYLNKEFDNWPGKNELREEYISPEELIVLIMEAFKECKKIGWKKFAQKYKLLEFGYGWNPESKIFEPQKL